MPLQTHTPHFTIPCHQQEKVIFIAYILQCLSLRFFFSGWRLNLVIIVVSYNSKKRTVNDVWLFCHEVVHCQNALSFFSGCLFFLVEINARSVSLTVFDLIVQFCFWCFFYTLCCALPPVCDFFYYLNNAEN